MFSVIVPLFNKRLYIRRCIDSVLRQSLEDFELIVVDDGSTDGSADELANISDSRFRLWRQDNAGVSVARNAGVEQARGQWVAFIDADDFWLPNHLSELEKIIALHPDAGLVATDYVERRVGEQIPVECERECETAKANYFIEAAKHIGVVSTSAVAVRRSVFVAVGGFKNYKLGEDLELWARIALVHPVALSKRVTAIYFRGTGGAMDNASAKEVKISMRLTLSDISPSVALLVPYLESKKYSEQENSIRTYINSRVYSCIRSCLYEGNVGAAKYFGSLLIFPYQLKLSILRVVLVFPEALLRIGLVAVRSLRAFR